MYARQLSIFSGKVSSFQNYLYGQFNWLYEHSPINFSYITGIRHPSVQRLTGNPIIGRSWEVTKSAVGFIKEIEKLSEKAKKDPLGRAYAWFGIDPNMLLTRPEDIAQVLMFNSDKVDRGELLEVFGAVFGKDNLLVMPSDEEWRKKRNELVDWIFRSKSLENLVEPMKKIVDEFISKIESNNQHHIASLEKEMVHLAMDVFARTRLGVSQSLNEKAQAISDGLGSALDAASEPKNTIWLNLDAILKYVGLRLSAHLDREKDNLQKIIKENFLEPNQENIMQTSNILKEHFDKHPNDINEASAEAVGPAGLFLLAGHETTSRLLQFVIILLSLHPDELKKVREEIATHMPGNGEWTYQDLAKLTYLEKVLKETLRLYPPIPVIPRKVTKPLILADIPLCKTREEYEEHMKKRDVTKDIILTPGNGVSISPWLTHRLPSVYENPDQFKPERFQSSSMSENPNQLKSEQFQSSSIFSSDNCKFLAFGAGDRNCVGRRFAKEEAVLFLVRFLMKYDFEASCKEGSLLDIIMRGTLKHKGDVQVSLKPRCT